MLDHTLQYIEKEPFAWIARCSCRMVFGPTRTKMLVEDLGLAHVRLIQTARTAMTGKNPSLEAQQKFFDEQSRDRRHTTRDRQLWKQLADELATRIGLNAPKSKQDTLF